MIKIENTVTPSDKQWEIIALGCRNAFNSWSISDSYWDTASGRYCLGEADLRLMGKLARAGDDHGKYMRMLQVLCNVTAPLYFWKQLDTYKIGTVANSCSTMHKITSKKFEKEDFSIEDKYLRDGMIYTMNSLLECYNDTENSSEEKSEYWMSIIQLLPESYNQMRTWSANYQVLKNIYRERRGHKLPEWQTFRDWIKGLPYSELITGGED